jgi:selenocysteine lyase/cysteine desulfurase
VLVTTVPPERFSPHFYNTMEEIDRAIGTVDEILSQMGVMAAK